MNRKAVIVIIVELTLVVLLLVGIVMVKTRQREAATTEEIIESGISGRLDDMIEEATLGDPETETATVSDAEDESIFSYPEIDFKPHAVSSTQPSNYFSSTDIMVDDTVLPDNSYYSEMGLDEILFDTGDKYTDEEGVFTFRGNNFRDNPTYGYANYEWGSLNGLWSVGTGSLTFEGATWSGSGWTGQPLMRHWSREAKKKMNMYDWAKEDDSLVEVIYACMDGYIYFLDMKTGEKTREPMWLGFTFKGAGALDPRGYPILYVGAGYDNNTESARSYIISLIDCSVLYTFGNGDPFSLRGNLSYFDSSAIVDADTDTLIYPGENGILYMIHLGTHYDEDKGSLSMDLDKVVKWRYHSNRTTAEKFWPGMESSAAIYKNYLFITDNGANLFCLDINTLETVWVQDILDDSNSTPVLSIEDGKLYIYVSTSFHLGWRSGSAANVPIWKIDAETGEIIWQTEYECNSVKGVSGGVQSTIAVGRGEMDEMIYVTVAMTHSTGSGDIVALRKSNGSKVWENQIPYTWSSPVCVYNEDGTGEVIYAASDGRLYCINGLTGEEKSHLSISDGTIEASPAVYEDYLVVGTRSGKIWGVRLE